ncbi:MAG: flippase-like domain-containing protein [Candidatus Aenigmarchaeota archaeon]|nr:flippase-like domain-containing protein [Candidatus Aenigmarchaeota archaeon]
MKSKANLLLFGIAALLLSALIMHSNPSAIVKTLSKANPFFIAIGLSVTLLIIGLKIVRWRILLLSIGLKTGFKQIMQPYMASLFMSNITPGRVGEPIRSYYLKKSLGHHISKTLPTVVVERILDLSTVVLFCIFGLYYLSGIPNHLFLAGIAIMVSLLTVVVGVSSSKKFFNHILKISYMIFRFFPKIRKLTPKFEKIASNFHAGFKLASKSNQMPHLAALTIVAWAMEFSVIKLSFLSIGRDIGFFVILSVSSLSTIISLLTFLPGNIGSFEATSAILLTQAMPGISLAEATSGILIYRFSSLIFALAVTSSSFLRYQRP